MRSKKAYKNGVNMKSQVLIFVIFIMLIAGTFGVLLSDMWSDEQGIRAGHRDSLVAFYLANAALEKGKIAILYDVANVNNIIDTSVNGTEGHWPGPTADDWEEAELDLAGDSRTFRFNFSVDDLAGPQIYITGRGEVLDSNNNVIAHREIEVQVEGIEDIVAPVGTDDDLLATRVGTSWTEI